MEKYKIKGSEYLVEEVSHIEIQDSILETKIYPNLVKALEEQSVNAKQLLTIICDCVFNNFSTIFLLVFRKLQVVFYSIFSIVVAHYSYLENYLIH